MGLLDFAKKTEKTELEKLSEIVEKHSEITDENKKYLTTLIKLVSQSNANIFDTEKEFITFVLTIINNQNFKSYSYEKIFYDANTIYGSLKTTGYSFNNAFIKLFEKNGLYESGYFSHELMMVFEYAETYFDVMDLILLDERRKADYESLKDLIIQLAVFTPNDLELRTMLTYFFSKYYLNGNIKDAIDEFIEFAKKRAGIYEELDEKYLAKIEVLIDKAKEVFNISKKEQEKLETIQQKISASRSDLEKIMATFDESLKRADETISQSTSSYIKKIEAEYFDLFGKLKNDANELWKTILVNSDVQAQKLAREAVAKIEKDVDELAQVKSKYELTTSEQLSQISAIKDEVQKEVRKGLQDIKNAIDSSNLNDLEGLEQLKELLTILPNDSKTIVAPSKEIFIPSSPSIDSSTANIEIPEVVSSFDRTLSYKERYNLIMDRKKRNQEKGEMYHQCVDDTIAIILAGGYPYLYGPSGSGKSFAVKQIADLIGIPSIDIGYITEEFEIVGGRNANGQYSPTSFYECWRNGYLAFCDELDNGVPQATVKLNSFMSDDINKSYPFPVVGFVKRHPNFCLIAAGNTKGMGATRAHSSRSKMDNSIIERFQYIKYEYDTNVENQLLAGKDDWKSFINLYRDAVNQYWKDQENDIVGQVTTRDIKSIVDYIDGGVWDNDKIIYYQFIEAKDQDYLAYISSYFDEHLAECTAKTKKLVQNFKGLCNHGKDE